jgi:malate dehydrogenase (oxaloacetate-decarboxylating)(NADP+)
VNQDRNHFAACMVALGDADAMVTGVTRNFSVALEDIRRCIDPKPGHRVMGVSLVLARGRTVLVADTAVTEMPMPRSWPTSRSRPPASRAASATSRAGAAGVLDLRPPPGERAAHVQGAVRILDQRRVDFEYDGDMAADVALNMELREAYPFCRLSGRPMC